MAAGTSSVIDLLTASLSQLEKSLVFHPGSLVESHTVVQVSGLDSIEVPVALGRYLVGALAGAVGLDAQLFEDLLARGVDRREEIRGTVNRLIGPDNVFTGPKQILMRDTRRNAWIGEGVGHALLTLSAHKVTSCVDGQVCTLTEIHQTPNRQGLDSVSTYVQNNVLGVGIGESKATRAAASENLTDAAGLFIEVEEGIHGPDLRARLAAFRFVLDPGLKDQVKDSLWTDNASYLPIVVFQENFDVTAKRPKLAQLKQPAQRRRVIVVQLPDFHGFFDAVADAMRAAVDEVIL
ncbi:hypothetical protein [Actinoplanes sp. NPDC026619]|uniref:hypothetical protein n=1 Tax=Actinoplanes sp. NPDC026619 TaxID=3155798 RepID=UPI0033E329B3